MPLALETLADLGNAITTLSESFGQIAASCRDHARDVESHRDEIIDLAVVLGVETVLIQLGTHLLALPTAGLSELVGQSDQAGKVVAAGVRIRAILDSLVDGVSLLVALLARAGETALREVPMLRRVARARVLHAPPSMEAANQVAALGSSVYAEGASARPPGWCTYLVTSSGCSAGTCAPTRISRRFEAEALGVLEVEMGRMIGERGETVVRVIVDPATNEVVSAYSIKSLQAVGIPR